MRARKRLWQLLMFALVAAALPSCKTRSMPDSGLDATRRGFMRQLGAFAACVPFTRIEINPYTGKQEKVTQSFCHEDDPLNPPLELRSESLLPPAGSWSYLDLFFERVVRRQKKRFANFGDFVRSFESFVFSGLYADKNESLGSGALSLFESVPFGRSLSRFPVSGEPLDQPRLLATLDGFAFTGKGHAIEQTEASVATGNFTTDARTSGFRPALQTWFGYVSESGSMEVISFNPRAARFEFQLLKGFPDQPRIEYANRNLCQSCHFSGSPIFPVFPWKGLASSVSAITVRQLGSDNPRNLHDALKKLRDDPEEERKLRERVGAHAEKARRKYAEYCDLYFQKGVDGVVVLTDQARVMDKLVAEASDFVTFQKVWSAGCRFLKGWGLQKGDCREAFLRATLTGETLAGAPADWKGLGSALSPAHEVFLPPYLPPLFSRFDPVASAGYDARDESTELTDRPHDCGLASGGLEAHPLCILNRAREVKLDGPKTVGSVASPPWFYPQSALALPTVSRLTGLQPAELLNRWLALDPLARKAVTQRDDFSHHRFYALLLSGDQVHALFGPDPEAFDPLPAPVLTGAAIPPAAERSRDPRLVHYYSYCGLCHASSSIDFLGGETTVEVLQKMRALAPKIRNRLNYRHAHAGFSMPPSAAGTFRRELYEAPEGILKQMISLLGDEEPRAAKPSKSLESPEGRGG